MRISVDDARLFEEILALLTTQYVTAAAAGRQKVTLTTDMPLDHAARWLDVASRVAAYAADEESMRRLGSPAVAGNDAAFLRGMLAEVPPVLGAVRDPA